MSAGERCWLSGWVSAILTDFGTLKRLGYWLSALFIVLDKWVLICFIFSLFLIAVEILVYLPAHTWAGKLGRILAFPDKRLDCLRPYLVVVCRRVAFFCLWLCFLWQLFVVKSCECIRSLYPPPSSVVLNGWLWLCPAIPYRPNCCSACGFFSSRQQPLCCAASGMYQQTCIRSILSSEARLVFSDYFARLGSSLSVAWLSALGGPASVAGATALAFTLICLWLICSNRSYFELHNIIEAVYLGERLPLVGSLSYVEVSHSLAPRPSSNHANGRWIHFPFLPCRHGGHLSVCRSATCYVIKIKQFLLDLTGFITAFPRLSLADRIISLPRYFLGF